MDAEPEVLKTHAIERPWGSPMSYLDTLLGLRSWIKGDDKD